MSGPVDASGFDRLLSQTLQMLNGGAGSNQGDDGSGEEAEPIEGRGHAADGLITATAVPGGRIADLHLDPRALRMESTTLAGAIVAAVNHALADLQERIRENAAVPDMNALAERLKEVQQESSRQMATFMQALVDAQQRIASSGRP